mmetsp:Transcript_24573/g.53698  ORF Transcript_24573/g.53698 Transcript_24573/m.53698 type:complete len:226 (-) Transcript_24573:246-923(-)
MLVEGDSQHAVCGEERLLHSVPVVHVDVNVQHAVVVLEHLQDRQHNVVDVAEARGLGFLGVVQAPGPVDHDVGHAVVEAHSTADGPPRIELAVLKHAVKHRTVICEGVRLDLPLKPLLIFWCDGLEEVYIVLGVEGLHHLLCGLDRPEGLEHAVEAIPHNQAVSHPNSMRLHGVAMAIIKVSYFRIIVICDLALCHFYSLVMVCSVIQLSRSLDLQFIDAAAQAA